MSRPEDKTILIVDDEPDVRTFFSGILERAGFNVETAANGNEALAAVRRHPPDLISLDLVMPEKSGIRFLYELRKRKEWARIPIMIVTAHARDEMGREDFDTVVSERTMVGPLTYLEKPVNPERFATSVKRALGLPVAPAELNGSGPVSLRDRISSRLDTLDAETLRRVLQTLDGETAEGSGEGGGGSGPGG